MKNTILLLINVLLISFTGMGQKNGEFKEFPGEYRKLIIPDTLRLKADTSLSDFFRSQEKLHRSGSQDSRRLPHSESLKKYNDRILPDYNPKEKEDIIVLNPGPFPDRMPNANVVTPGVQYFLKVVPSGKKKSNVKDLPPAEELK